MEIGYRGDGTIWVTDGAGVEARADAERYLNGDGDETRWVGVQEGFVGFTGVMANSKDEAWDECLASTPGARRAWRLVDTFAEQILEDGDWSANPHYVPPSGEPEIVYPDDPVDEEAVQRAVWLVESVTELGMNAQRARRMEADATAWIAPIVEQLGAAGRCARLLRGMRLPSHVTTDELAGVELREEFARHVALAAAESLHATADFRLRHEGGSDRQARDTELAEALSTALEGRELCSQSASAEEQLLWIIRYLGEAGDALSMAEGVWARRYAPPEWVEEEHESVADAVRFGFQMVLGACIDTLAIFAPQDLDPESIDQPSFWDEVKTMSDHH